MKTEDDQSDGARKYAANGLRVIVGIFLFPVLWIGVGVNFFGLAERLSFLPGVRRKGGVVSGVAALMMTVLVLGVVVGGASAATGGGIPVIDEGEEPVATSTPTPTPEPTPTATPTPEPKPTATPTQEPTPTKDPRSDLGKFEDIYRDQVSDTMENESLTGVPVLATDYRTADDGAREFWLVYWECDQSDHLNDQRVSVANNFVNTVAEHDGSMPDRVRAYGVTNLENWDDTTTYIKTSEAMAGYNGTMSPKTYFENWWERQQEPTEERTEIAFQMVVDESGQEKADGAFNQDNEGVGGCPGDAEGVDDE